MPNERLTTHFRASTLRPWSALGSNPGIPHPFFFRAGMRSRGTSSFFQAVARRLEAEMKRLVDGKGYLSLPLKEDKQGEKAPSRRLAEITGLKVKLQPKGGSLESHTLSCFLDETLLGS